MSDAAPHVTQQDALAAARHWNPEAHHPVHLRSSENSTWRVTLGDAPCVLRFTAGEHRARSQLEAELDFVTYLSAGSLRVARPLPTPGGERVLDVSGFIATREPTYVTAFEWLDGRPYEYRSGDIDRQLLRLWGETMARLHQLSSVFVAPGTTRPDWPDDPVAGCHVRGLAIDHRTRTLRDQLVGWLRGMAPHPAHYGMVHGDFERTNFLLDGQAIAIFDFDDCCRHWFAWDIACALWVFRNDTAGTRARLLDWFLEGYATVKEPDQPRLEHFSELIRLRTIALLLHRRRRGGEAEPAARDWMTRNEVWLHSPWRW